MGWYRTEALGLGTPELVCSCTIPCKSRQRPSSQPQNSHSQDILSVALGVFFELLAESGEEMRAHHAGRQGQVPLVWNDKGVGLWAFPWPHCRPGPQESEVQSPGIQAGRANSSSRSILAVARAPPTQMRLSLGLWKPELMKFQKDGIVWVWASARDADGAAEGP